MLLSFRVENHKSIREEQQLLLTPVYDDARPQEADWEAATVAGIFGANASGKSNLLDALSFMRDTVRWSMSHNEPGSGIQRHPFKLSADAREEPSTFVVDLVIDRVRHTYGFGVDDERVVEEWLYSYPRQRKRVVFERDGQEFSFGDQASGKLRQVKEITGRNVLFLTVAARASNAEVEPAYRWFSESLVSATERSPDHPAWLRGGAASEERMTALGRLLKSADTGIEAVELHEQGSGSGPGTATSKAVLAAGEGPRLWAGKQSSQERRDDRGSSVVHHLATGSGKTASYLALFENLIRERTTLLFHHRGEESATPLLWEEESLGTRAFTTIGFDAQRVLETGGALVVDEIDASLHPYLSAKVISLFQDEEHNPKGAQLIFTSHDAALLGRVRGEEVLKRDHIWFVDKDDRGRTSLYPLSDFRPRGDDNRARRYLTGRYGAVPDVDDELFRDALRRREQSRESEEAAP
ncbi:AAA family ATPase [Nocardiopsis dassonvillei]|uniref:AAA family ATPase n=1 Tax=Nocardiopsis dassonvillei TaxID=2014 RepID=UPI0020A473A6|nr:ATP-binding protein [Nocardiopsis dassonvillei]MCP3014746.1 AAA family ATPase [Nocardiopsis dassonvillei]